MSSGFFNHCHSLALAAVLIPTVLHGAVEIKQAGIKWITWTVDDAALAKKLVAAGVDGITTDHPARLRENLKIPSP